MKKRLYNITETVLVFPGDSAWFFVTLPKDISARIQSDFTGLHRGWRSLPIEVRIGRSRWMTSMFYYTPAGGYIVPLKKSIRKKEDIYEGDSVRISVRITV